MHIVDVDVLACNLCTGFPCPRWWILTCLKAERSTPMNWADQFRALWPGYWVCRACTLLSWFLFRRVLFERYWSSMMLHFFFPSLSMVLRGIFINRFSIRFSRICEYFSATERFRISSSFYWDDHPRVPEDAQALDLAFLWTKHFLPTWWEVGQDRARFDWHWYVVVLLTGTWVSTTWVESFQILQQQ